MLLAAGREVTLSTVVTAWNVGDLPMRALIPSLTIQPLLENAIYHGIELLPDGGDVVVTGKRDGDDLTIEIANPLPTDGNSKDDGNKMALANIRQRFELAYGSKANVGVDITDHTYKVSMRFPADEADG